MEEKIIYLSPSTQEKNIGVLDYGTEEYRMNRIADILEKLLQEKGYVVYRNSVNDTPIEIAANSNEIGPDIHLALHSNAGNMVATGPEIFTNKKGTKADLLAQDIYKEILNIYYNKEAGRGVKYTDNLYEVREVDAPSVLLEIAFHDNVADANWIMENEENIAKAILAGIENYFRSFVN